MPPMGGAGQASWSDLERRSEPHTRRELFPLPATLRSPSRRRSGHRLNVSMRHAVSRSRRARGDGGASAVEFALVAPLLFLLIAGTIEFGWAFHQIMDLRHGAR
ncbi:MAG: TadE family protein, partial [Actinomycetota bacterium]